MSEQNATPGISAIVTDIEGTVGSIDFVRDTLFPYAREHLPAFIEAHGDEPEVRHWLEQAAREGNLPGASRDEVVAVLLGWIDEDRKATPLKALQGMIWKHGYESGAYRAHLYPEVPGQLRKWQAANLRLYVYSSGSIPAQQLYFKYSDAGDLSNLFSGFYDTTTGGKRESSSYVAIAKNIDVPPAQILFLSDTVEELDAAAAVGMRTFQLCRPPLSCPHTGDHRCADDFNHIAL